VGYMVFCDHCFDVENDLYFADKDFEINPKSDVYKKWLKVYKEFITEVE